MSRVADDPNRWKGDLNDTGLSAAEIQDALDKTNGGVTSVYGQRGVGASGNVKDHGSGHSAVFELSGDGILTEDGVPVTRALEIAVPADAVVGAIVGYVHEVFTAGSVIVKFESQVNPGAPLVVADLTIAPVDLTVAGVQDLAPVAFPGDRTFELGGTLFIDMTDFVRNPASRNGGTAEVEVSYRAL